MEYRVQSTDTTTTTCTYFHYRVLFLFLLFYLVFRNDNNNSHLLLLFLLLFSCIAYITKSKTKLQVVSLVILIFIFVFTPFFIIVVWESRDRPSLHLQGYYFLKWLIIPHSRNQLLLVPEISSYSLRPVGPTGHSMPWLGNLQEIPWLHTFKLGAWLMGIWGRQREAGTIIWETYTVAVRVGWIHPEVWS